jgi:hypothetical protein
METIPLPIKPGSLLVDCLSRVGIHELKKKWFYSGTLIYITIGSHPIGWIKKMGSKFPYWGGYCIIPFEMPIIDKETINSSGLSACLNQHITYYAYSQEQNVHVIGWDCECKSKNNQTVEEEIDEVFGCYEKLLCYRDEFLNELDSLRFVNSNENGDSDESESETEIDLYPHHPPGTIIYVKDDKGEILGWAKRIGMPFETVMEMKTKMGTEIAMFERLGMKAVIDSLISVPHWVGYCRVPFPIENIESLKNCESFTFPEQITYWDPNQTIGWGHNSNHDDYNSLENIMGQIVMCYLMMVRNQEKIINELR